MALAGQQQQSAHYDDDMIRSSILRVDSSCQMYLLNAMDEYGKALRVGEKHLYQVVPRLLSIWFDFNSIKETEKTEFEPSNVHIDNDQGKLIFIS